MRALQAVGLVSAEALRRHAECHLLVCQDCTAAILRELVLLFPLGEANAG